ncbi:L-threonate dehydrogenase [Paracoccus endophyticus]|uniref:L-threonate dehydrogenase n=1 Tax=Paracoccus endophyticus TaxID=2233774 RepID=UPI000DDB8F72|nr:L-threonate dehydrogenase [Paracoccus endophyticus]
MRAAVIGLGSMGQGAALSLLRAGIDTAGCDIRPEAAASLADAGGRTAATPAQAAAGADVVFVYVMNAAQSDAVLFGDDGAVAAAAPGTVFLLCATMPPADAERLGARLAEAGMLAIDAPVSGGSVRAASGQITVMASGPAAAFDRAGPALDAVAARVFRLGERPGDGSRMKMINQLLAGVHIAAAAEAMVLAASQRMDLAQVLEVISTCAGTSWMFENRGPHIVAGDWTPHSAVDIFVKDLGIVTGAANAAGCPVPLSQAALDLFRAASDAGMGRLDDAAVARVLAARAGVALPGDAGSGGTGSGDAG